MVSNIPSSAYRYGAGILDAVTHPVRTGKAVSGLVLSVGKKGQRKVNELVSGVDISPEGEEAADAMIEGAKNRYGSVDAFQRTLMNDPVGVLGDAASFTGAGAALKIPGAARVGAMLEPLNVTAKAVRGGSKLMLPRTFAANMYEKAVKPGAKYTPEQAAKIVQTGVDEGLMPTRAGLSLLKEKIRAPKQALDAKIAEATNLGIGIPSSELFKYLNDLKQKMGGVLVEAGPDLRRIQKIEDDLVKQLNGRLYLTPEEVQKFKTNAYKKTYKAEKKDKTTKAETYSALSRAAKEAIENVVPDAKQLNAEMAPLLNVEKTLANATRRIENQPLTFGMPIGVGMVAGDVLGSAGLGTAAAVASKITSLPKVKASLAIKLNNIKKGNIGLLDQNAVKAQTRLTLALAQRQEEERRRREIQEE
jgi:hypothetical protein